MERTLDRLARIAAEQIGTGARTDDPGERARAYRAAADVMVEAREHFLTDDGEPDWRGATYAYRMWVGDVYSRSGVTSERAKVLGAVRYQHRQRAARAAGRRDAGRPGPEREVSPRAFRRQPSGAHGPSEGRHGVVHGLCGRGRAARHDGGCGPSGARRRQGAARP